MTKLLNVFALTLLLGSALSVSACNTVEGAGEDIESGGRAIEGAAEDASN